MAIQSLKGFDDLLPEQTPRWRAVEKIAHETAARFNYKEIRTPILESADVFHRGVGETSDIVKKETYTFTDRDGDSVTLRPEGTAGVVRAVIEAGFLNDQGARAKVYYIGPNFRHERPQKGRVRQHHQFGVEAFGVPSPEQDVECIDLQMSFYARCGLRDLALNVNSLGDRESKERYRDALVAYLSPKRESLSEDSQRRLETNALRILDSKDPRDKAACEGAPSAVDSLSEKSRLHFERVDCAAEAARPHVQGRSDAGARVRLLHRHAVGSHRGRAWLAERRRRGRALRQSRRATRRQAHAWRGIRQWA